MSKINDAIQFATRNVPMKLYPQIVAKSAKKIDQDELATIPREKDYKFYASVSITVGSKEFMAFGKSDSSSTNAVCDALANLHRDTVQTITAFRAAIDLTHKFLIGLN